MDHPQRDSVLLSKVTRTHSIQGRAVAGSIVMRFYQELQIDDASLIAQNKHREAPGRPSSLNTHKASAGIPLGAG
ncbi:hypothetical protein RGR602_PC01254 (plasmid) [Rhizobium gallicum bv. gallicum R602sp]|uniref:Uncharacterized protein n=1 Tax=Rhizobium gallicum bv. gallicum R602sp TaxID=1041138 RepID=A0A0B4XFM5_9HYPH|nr:hypothetical protein RGR602_PC01254 [Rhizobium gallicum bv. gallicum R602sp]